MKWVILLAMFLGIPLVARWLAEKPERTSVVSVLMGALPFVYGAWHLNASPISWAIWPGYVDGTEISVLDALAIAILISGAYRKYKLPFKPAMYGYFVAVLIAVPLADTWMAAAFYPWQLLRMFLVFAAVALLAADRRNTNALIAGMILGLTYSAGSAIWAKMNGAWQTGGTVGHQNLLGMVSHMIVLPSLALLLSGQRTRWAVLGLASGGIAVVLTASRATIGFAGFGFALLLVLSAIHRGSGRKFGMVLLGAAILAAATPFAMSNLQKRFGTSKVDFGATSDGEREAFKRAARLMIADHPMGVGPNSYVVVANLKGYSQKGGVAWNSGSRGTNVHNLYLLTNAEAGYLGLAALAWLFLSAIGYAFSCAWRFRNDPRSEIILGIGVSFITVALHSFFEWIFVVAVAQYVFAIWLGILAGLHRQMIRKVQAKRMPPQQAVNAQPDLADLPVVTRGRAA